MRGTQTMVRIHSSRRRLFQWPAVTFSVRAPTTNPFLMNSQQSEIDTCTEHDTNTVDARTFPTVHAATPRAM